MPHAPLVAVAAHASALQAGNAEGFGAFPRHVVPDALPVGKVCALANRADRRASARNAIGAASSTEDEPEPSLASLRISMTRGGPVPRKLHTRPRPMRMPPGPWCTWGSSRRQGGPSPPRLLPPARPTHLLSCRTRSGAHLTVRSARGTGPPVQASGAIQLAACGIRCCIVQCPAWGRRRPIRHDKRAPPYHVG